MSEPPSLKEGVEAPDFCLPSSEGGKELCLSELRGKWVVLYFYPRDGTSGCTTEAVEFSGLNNEFEELNALVLGLSKDSPDSHRNFIQRRDLRITLLSDGAGKVLEAYGAWRLKKMYGKESWGVVRSTVLIDPEGKAAKIWPKVPKAAGHAAKVLEELKTLLGREGLGG